MGIYDTQKFGRRRMQSGIPFRQRKESLNESNGLLLTGVVTATYVIDDPHHPYASDSTANNGAVAVAVYCDVLIYSNIAGIRYKFLPRVLVSQERGGIHDGEVWKPKATQFSINDGAAVPTDSGGLAKGMNPGLMDGDHVMVGFLNNSLNEPVVIRAIPHPSADEGNLDLEAGQRKRLKVADGDPRFIKHHGAYFGVEDAGDYIVNTLGSHDGKTDESGNEPAPDNAKGNQTYKLPQDATHLIEWSDNKGDRAEAPEVKVTVTTTKDGGMIIHFVDENVTFTMDPTQLKIEIDGATLLVQDKDGNATFKLGDGAKSAMIAEAWETFFDGTLATWIKTHNHGSGVGPTTPPVQAGAFPVVFGGSGNLNQTHVSGSVDMALAAATLGDALKALSNPTTKMGFQNDWSGAWATYWEESEATSAATVAANTSPALAVTAFETQIGNLYDADLTPLQAATFIGNACADFWTQATAILAYPTSPPPLGVYVLFPPFMIGPALAAFIAAISAVLLANKVGEKSKDDSLDALATAIHTGQAGATFLDTTTPSNGGPLTYTVS